MINSFNDSLIRIKNGYKLNFDSVFILKSKKIIKVLDILYLEGYIRGYSFDPLDIYKIKVLLKYSGFGEGSFRKIKVISVSSKRVYVSVDTLFNLNLKKSLGCFILSTSKGILSLNDALKYNIGGELLCYVV
jgi:small subunit ribosomal protein S8